MGTSYLQIDNLHLFLWFGLMLFISMGMETQRDELVMGRTIRRTTPFFALLVFLPIIIMTVYGRPRSDTYLYLSTFRGLPSTVREGWAQVREAKEPGFVLFELIVKQLFGTSETAYRMAIALVHAIPIMVVFRRYSERYLFSIYLFVASGCHLAWMMNGMRQFMAVTIIFAATPWIVEKRYFRTILVILLAASFHRTALYMLPVVFIVQGEAWNWKTILFSVAVVIAAFVFSQSIDVFEDIAETVGYSTEWARNGGDDGANPLRVLVSAVPMVLAFFSRENLREEHDRLINICVNMSVITTGIYLIAMVTSGIMVGRMPIYTSLYSLILLPHVIRVYFNERSRPFVMFAAVGLYFLHFVVQWSLIG